MDKKTGIIIGLLVVVFGAFVVWRLTQNTSISYRDYDLNAVIPASEDTGGLEELVEGDADAPVLIFEYGDYQCTACAPMNPYINKLLEEYGDKVALVFRTYILSYHNNGTAAASAALAAAQQGYWKAYKDLLFTNQGDWYYSDATKRQTQFEDYFLQVSNNQGDLVRFREDMTSKAVSQKISFDMGIGNFIGLTATPIFYIDGERFLISSGMSREDFVDKMRKKIDAKLAELGIE